MENEISTKPNEDNVLLLKAQLSSLEKKNKYYKLLNSLKLTGFILFLCFELFFFYNVAVKYKFIEGIDTNNKDVKIAIMNINKPITSDYVYTLIEKMEEIKFKDEYKEILIVVNSPGGSPSASDEFSEYLKDFQEYKKITMYVEGMAASGAYYIASAIKPLYINKNAILGSIGVIMPKYTIGEFAEKVGIKEDNIVAGKFKSPISLFKDVSDDDKEYLKTNIMNPMYKNFVSIIAKNRELPYETIEKYAEGQIFLGTFNGIHGILFDKFSNFISLKKEINSRLIYNDKSLKEEDIQYKVIDESKLKKNLLGIDLNLNSDLLNNLNIMQ